MKENRKYLGYECRIRRVEIDIRLCINTEKKEKRKDRMNERKDISAVAYDSTYKRFAYALPRAFSALSIAPNS